MPTIKSLQKRIGKFLNTSAESGKESIANIFSRPYEEIFNYLWQLELPENVRLPDINDDINRKGASESEAFRNEGNRLYKAHKFDKALLAYNYAILSAPHPATTPKDEEDTKHQKFCPLYRSKYPEGQHSELALAFANRSALLLEMEQNQAAVEDIHHALLYGYPFAKQYKMFERKVKCLINIEQFPDAESLSESILANIASFDLSKNELSQLQSNLRRLISKGSSSTQPSVSSVSNSSSSEQNIQNDSNSKTSQKTQTKLISRNKGKYWRLFYRGADDFALSGPGATDGSDGAAGPPLAVERSPSRGCFLKATRDIRPGELLLVETCALSFLSLGPLLRTHCSHCLRRAPAPLPCPSCSLAVFCDAACRRAALGSAGGHFAECSLLPALVALKPEVDAGLAFRAATAVGFQGLKFAGKKTLQGATEDNHLRENSTNTAEKGPDQVLQNPFGDCVKDYNFLFSLEGNHSMRTVEDKKEAGITALLLVKLLLKCPAFWGNSSSKLDTLSRSCEDILEVGGQLIHILLNIQCNAHCVKEFQVRTGQPLNQGLLVELGYVLHRQLSLLNHSCTANCHLSSYGNRKLLYAIASIRQGEEVTLSYGERFVSHDKTKRLENLKKSYYFECDCIACTQNWPLFAELPMKFSLRCCKCSGAIDAASSKCNKCQCLHKNQQNKKNNKKGKKSNQKECPQDVFDAPSVQTLISKSWQEYNQAYANMEKFPTEHENINKVANLLTLMDKYAHLPNKPYIDAQETCMRWYDLRASVLFLTE